MATGVSSPPGLRIAYDYRVTSSAFRLCRRHGTFRSLDRACRHTRVARGREPDRHTFRRSQRAGERGAKEAGDGCLRDHARGSNQCRIKGRGA